MDPQYMQVTRKDAAKILAISVTELDRRRKHDPHCPVGFKDNASQLSPVRFRLADIYTYSEHLMAAAVPASSAAK